MLADVVIDTNVLMHAANPQEPTRDEALSFLERLRTVKTSICVDKGFGMKGANTSRIGHEYRTHLTPGSPGYAFIVFVATNQRLKMLSGAVEVAIARKINQRVPKPSDRVFIRVAINSESKKLASHDFADFTRDTRQFLSKENGIKVQVLTAKAASALL
jgi:predicted nucleic acid-binding protein